MHSVTMKWYRPYLGGGEKEGCDEVWGGKERRHETRACMGLSVTQKLVSLRRILLLKLKPNAYCRAPRGGLLVFVGVGVGQALI